MTQPAGNPRKTNGNGKPPPEEPLRDAPPHDLNAERAVLGSVLYSPELLPGARELNCECYYSDAHKWIARAIISVSHCDVTVVASWLKERGRLEQAGTTKYLSELLEVPFIGEAGVRANCEIIRKKWQLRLLKTVGSELVALAQTASVCDPVAAIRDAAERYERAASPPDESTFGFWGTDFGDVDAEPERETWLLTDVLTGKPVFPLGRCGMISAAGGTGKTTNVVALAVAIALKLEWCGFRVETDGCVALCCGESDRKLMQRQIWRAMNSLGLTREQRELAMSQILFVPLSGVEVNLIRGTANNEVERTEFLSRFAGRLRKLASEGNFSWTAIILDPLSRFGGPDTESNNSAATKFAQALETLTTLPGTPSVITTHHSSKNSITAGRNDSRGVSGLRDAFRWVMVLTRVKVETIVGVLVECDKSNEAPHFQSRWLVQETRHEIAGTLRLATDPEAAVLHEAIEAKHKKRGVKGSEPTGRTSSTRDVVLTKLRELGGVAKSRRWLRELLTGVDNNTLQATFAQLEHDGVITIDSSGPTRGRVQLVGFEPQQQLALQSNGLESQQTTEADQ